MSCPLNSEVLEMPGPASRTQEQPHDPWRAALGALRIRRAGPRTKLRPEDIRFDIETNIQLSWIDVELDNFTIQ